jgi:alkanesulfonate monooxygenase SsuD/methylene tetrahydromethanopterin reductase-like flavin-dependent oxidoreductase (luciferase family)
MKFAVHLPQFEQFGDVRTLVQLAQETEAAGWDGFFIWDHILFDDLWHPMVDPWVALGAIAYATERIHIGPMVTPLARRRPWKLARETVSVDQISDGRLILSVGLGDPVEGEFEMFGEPGDPRTRAEKLDEGLEILAGLWSGEPFSYQGKHYQLQEMTFLPRPTQRPRIPIWVGGYWPHKAPLRRAARWDGICPGGLHGPLTPDDWRALLAYIQDHRSSAASFDAVHLGTTPAANPQQALDLVAPYREAGVTWWVENINPYELGLRWHQRWPDTLVDQMKDRIRQGPPRLSAQ